VLFQLDDQGNERPIEYFSQKLNKCQIPTGETFEGIRRQRTVYPAKRI